MGIYSCGLFCDGDEGAPSCLHEMVFADRSSERDSQSVSRLCALRMPRHLATSVARLMIQFFCRKDVII